MKEGYKFALVKFTLPIVLMLLLLTACGVPVKEELYSESLSEDISSTNELTQEEKKLYSTAVEYANSQNTDLSSKTVGLIITDEKERQRKIQEEEKKKEEELRRKQEEAEREKQEKTKLLDESVKVDLIKKSVTYEDIDKWIFSDIVKMTLNFENTSKRSVKGFQGVITFKDMFGNKIKSLNLKYDEQLLADSSTTYDGSFEVNQFMDEDIELRDTPIDKIKVEFEMDQIIFDDGTTIKRSDI